MKQSKKDTLTDILFEKTALRFRCGCCMYKNKKSKVNLHKICFFTIHYYLLLAKNPNNKRKVKS